MIVVAIGRERPCQKPEGSIVRQATDPDSACAMSRDSGPGAPGAGSGPLTAFPAVRTVCAFAIHLPAAFRGRNYNRFTPNAEELNGLY